jgi:hypothetical protein
MPDEAEKAGRAGEDEAEPGPSHLALVSPAENQHMSKHEKRRERRAKYRDMLRAELDEERGFSRRVIRTLNHGGLDVGPDGRPIKADFFGAIQEWEKTDQQSSRACLSLVEKVVRQIQVRPVINR